MEIVERATGLKKSVSITRVVHGDLKSLTKQRYFFKWKELYQTTDLYKLNIEGDDDILGVMALQDIPGDYRIEIKLLASSRENVGANKKYEHIAGCMIAYACGIANRAYADLACVSLLPKTELKKHYIQCYHMLDGGAQVFLEAASLNNMIKKYLL